MRLHIKGPTAVPIYLASLGPKNLELTGQTADGWLGVFFDSEHRGPDQVDVLRRARAEAGVTDPIDISPAVMTSVGNQVEECADALRPEYARYIGGMGSPDVNPYFKLMASCGYESQAERVHELYQARRIDESASAVPTDFIDRTAILGSPTRVPSRLDAFAEAGVTTLCAYLTQHDWMVAGRQLDALRGAR
jgi:alkanesulfonate monooxygenase SsuD/methylene tetrahydromethanopterin reductase-like flavin-dependent oxidoreductase (luciferase family)